MGRKWDEKGMEMRRRMNGSKKGGHFGSFNSALKRLRAKN